MRKIFSLFYCVTNACDILDNLDKVLPSLTDLDMIVFHDEEFPVLPYYSK